MKTKAKQTSNQEYLNSIPSSGVLTFGSRLKRLTEILFTQVQELYKRREKYFKPTWFAFLFNLRDGEAKDLKTIAGILNITPSAASQVLKELVSEGLVKTQISVKDSRFKSISISNKGLKAIESIVPELKLIEDVLTSLLGGDLETVMARLNHVEKELKAKPFHDRTLSSITVIPYNKKYKQDFDRLNREWLEKYFYLTEHDEEQLHNPGSIVKAGGETFFALEDGHAIGTLALVRHSDTTIELAKMGVEEAYRGQGIGNLLVIKAIDYARNQGYQEIIVTTNSNLKAAISLYKKHGFSKYTRQDADELLEKYGSRADISFRLILS